MRVTNSSTYRNYTTSVNNVHANLNKSLNKISSGREYESAAENPISYYRGKAIDSQYLDVLSKSSLITDVKARLEQQEDGAYHIQNLLAEAKKTVIKARTATTTGTAVGTLRDELLQKEHSIVNDLTSQYQDFYVYGGNDISTPPFSLSDDGMTLTYSHVFPGEDEPTDFVMKLTEQTDPTTGEGTGEYKFELQEDTANTPPKATPERLVQAMSEQGYMDLGYGDIRDHSTLLDTYTGGLNLLTGLTSNSIISSTSQFGTDAQKYEDYVNDTIMEKLTNGPLGLIAQSVMSMDNYLGEGTSQIKDGLKDDREKLDKDLARLMDEMAVSEHTTSTVYSDLGNKYKILEDTETRLNTLKDALTVQYKDVVGADPYASIYEMFNNQYAYNAALQVGSNLMQSSLFDFVR